MIGLIIWIVGAVLTIKACFEIFTLDAAFWKKLAMVIVLLATSWIGLIFYYIVGKKRIAQWLS